MGVSWSLMGRALEGIIGLSLLVELEGVPWVKQYTKCMGMGRMTVSERATNVNSPHDGYCRTTSFDCGEMGKDSECRSSQKRKDWGREEEAPTAQAHRPHSSFSFYQNFPSPGHRPRIFPGN